MDYDDNDLQSQNLHLAGEGNNKFPPVLRSYDLPRFDFDDNLRGHLRFDSLVETEVFLGIESGEDNQWIEEFSRGSTGIAFSSSAAEPCLISRRNNVWSEAASSESVEMLLKSLGQDENNLAQTISKDSDACDDLGCIIKQMDPSLKHTDSDLSKVGDDIQPALQTSEIPGICIGDRQLIEEASQTHEREASIHGALEDPNSGNTDIPTTETDELKDGKQVVLDENQVEASVDQSLNNRGQEGQFASRSEVDTAIPSAQSACTSSVLIDDQDSTHLKNDFIDKNADSLERGSVALSPEHLIGGRNLIDDTVASVTSHVQKHSALDMQSREEHAIRICTANVSEPSRTLKGSSYLHAEECSEGVGVEIHLQTGKSEDIVSSQGKLYDTSPMPVVIDSILKEHENEVSGTDTISCTGLESKVNLLVQVASDAIEKEDLLESDCRPDKKILSSKSEKSLLIVEDCKDSKDEDKGSHVTLVAEPMRVCEKYVVTEHNDDHKCDESVSDAANLKISLPSDCSSADCCDDGSPLLTKGIDSSSFSAGGKVNELTSNPQPDVPVSSKSVDCLLLPSAQDIPTDAILDQKVVQVPSLEASFSSIKTSGTTTEKDASYETDEPFSCKKVDQPLLREDTTTIEGESGDQTLCRVSDSTVRKTDGDEAQFNPKKVSMDAAGDVSTQLNKTSMNSVPSTSMETSHNADQNHLKDSDSKLVSEEISGPVVVHHVDVDPEKTCNTSFSSAPSSESQTKFRMMESGSSSADLENPSCGSPIVIRTSEQSQSKIENEGVRGSQDRSALASGITNEDANKEQSISQDTKGNDATPGDKSFTFEVPPLLAASDQETGKNWKPFSTMQHDKTSSAMEETPSTYGLSIAGPKAAQETSHTTPPVTKRGNVRGGSKGTSERKPRRSGGKSAGKEARKGNATKETTPARHSERSDRKINLSLSSAGTGQLVQSNEMQHHGHIEGVFQQPFTDLQQVQLRAQIFVYGSLIQGIVPDEAYMISAFGGLDGGRTIWENAWRAGIERVYGQKSLLVSPETPLQSHIGAKTSDQPIKQKTLQSKVTSSPASWSTSKGTPTTSIVNPMIPLSSPLWSIRAPSGDSLQPTGLPRGAVMDYQLAISPLHPPPTRNFIGHNTPWMSQSPFRAPWSPQTSAFDGNACYPVRPIMEAINLNPVKASLPQNSSVKQVSAVPMVQSGNPANVFAGIPLIDTKKPAVMSGQHSADPKPRKRKKSTVPEEPGQIISHFQPESLLATVAVSHAITTPASNISESSTDKFTPVSANHLKKGDQESDQRASLSEETLNKHENAQKHAEDAAALAAAAVSQSQEIWNQLNKHKNSGLAPDVETQLTSAAVAIAAAAAVAKAAAAAANVASNAALQAKLMAEEALVSSGYRNSIPNNSISDGVKKLSKATPASILRGENATTSSNPAIVVAREAARRKLEAASAASKQAENMDAIVKAAELAAEAVSQAGKIVAMGEPFSLTELVEAGSEAYWKVPQASHEPDGGIREHINIVSSVEAPGSSVGHLKVPMDKREKQSDNHGKSLTLREMTRESIEDHSMLTDLAPVATSEKDKKGKKGRKAPDVAKTKGVASESQIGFRSPLITTQSAREKAEEWDNNIREGSHVEVLRDGGGSRAAWFLADILDLKDGKAYVCYHELRQEDGDKLKEWVELELEGYSAPRIRYSRPITSLSFEGMRKRRRADMEDYNWSVGDRVDAWMQNSWWEGVVTEKSKKDQTSFTIHFPAQGETSVVKAWLLRPSLMWKEGSWVGWSNSLDKNESSHEGDTPQEKRQRICNPAVEAKGKDELSKNVDNKESGQADDTRLLDLSASEVTFNIGKSTRDESKPDSLRMLRTGLKKKGPGVVFGVPKPGKKQKFMEVSKHYVADQSSKTCETSYSDKFTKYLMPRGFEPGGTKNKTEPKEKQMDVSKPKMLNPGKLPSISSRRIPQKDHLSNTMVTEPDIAVASDVSKLEDSISHAENISGKPNMMEFKSFSSSDAAAKGPVLFSSTSLSLDAPLRKASASNAKSERISEGKLAPAARKLAKIEEKVFNGKSTKTSSDVVEPRRSVRRIQPTSRLLEGIQSSLTISKIPSVSHDKNQKSQSRSMRGNNQG